MVTMNYAAEFTAEERNAVNRIQMYVDENRKALEIDMAAIEIIRYEDGKMAVKYFINSRASFIISEGASKDTYEFLDLVGDAGFVDSFAEYVELVA